MDADAARAFTPGKLGPLTLRNRVVKTATNEGAAPKGVPGEQLAAFHRAVAAGGVGMTTVAYCAVSADARTFGDQLWIRPEVLPQLRALTDGVHREGAAASLQLAHAGFFTQIAENGGRGALGPSTTFNAYGLGHGRAIAHGMTENEMNRVVDDFGTAAALAAEAGFDAVELHLGHGYLLSQFLSPATNRRRDAWGGSVANRLRLPLAVLRRVREKVGGKLAVLAKTNLRDGFAGGLELPDAVEIAKALEANGLDAIVPSGGFTSRTPFFLMRGDPPLRDMIAAAKSRAHAIVLRLVGRFLIRGYPFEENFFQPDAQAIRAAVKMPIVLLGGVVSTDGLAAAMRQGFDFVAMGRALIADPDLLLRMQRGEAERSRCVHCNRCVAEMDRGGTRCVLG